MHFVGDIRSDESRCVRQTGELVCQSDRHGRDDQHEHDCDRNFFPRRGEVVAFGMVPRVFPAEGTRTPKASAMSGETMNHVLEEAPGQDPQTSCAENGTDHGDAWISEALLSGKTT